jgi:hypothetical protein
MSSIPRSRAPDWTISQWFNTPDPQHHLSLPSLRGSVIVMHAFQILCPACVSYAIPQARAIHAAFPPERLKVIGLHTVFEHHEAMTPTSLKAFLLEYRVRFPVGVDQTDPDNPIPVTMQAYGFQGTPSLVLIDKAGCIRLHHFGHLEDLQVGAVIGQLLTEEPGDV